MERKEDIGRMHTAGLTIDFEYGELWRGLHRSNPLSFKRPYSWIVYKDRDKYMAEDWRGRIRFEDDDASEVINSCINALPEMGGLIFIKSGIYDLYSQLTINDKYVWICGEGRGVQFHDVGTVLRKQFDGDLISISYSDPNASGFIIEKLKIEGNRTEHTGRGISISSAKGWILRDVIIRNCGGNALYVENCGWHRLVNVFCGACDGHIIYYTSTGDWLWVNVEADTVMTDDKDAVYLSGSPGIIINSHFESGIDHGRHGIYIGSTTVFVIGCFIGFCGYHGIHAYNSSKCVIMGNRIVDVNCRDLTAGAYISLASSECLVIGNVFDRSTSNYGHPKYNVRVTRDDNIIVYNRFIPDPEVGTIIDTGSGNKFKGNINYPTENSGVAVFSGDGSTTTFRIEHGLANTPSKYVVSPLTPDADASRTITVDSTYITITFDTAPPSGTDNIKFGWWAEV